MSSARITKTENLTITETMTGSRSKPYNVAIEAHGVRVQAAGYSWTDAAALAYAEALKAVAMAFTQRPADSAALMGAYQELRSI